MALLLVLIGLTIVISIQTVGVGRVAAMLVTPAATAYLLARRLPAMMAISALCGAAASVAGLYLSYYANIASGAAIVLAASFLFLLAFLFSPRQGAMRWLRNIMAGIGSLSPAPSPDARAGRGRPRS